jgi:pimeloyl-ACP methyl ester carboxylesterase
MRTARAWRVLMSRLGYERFIAYGSDWGSGVAACVGRAFPESVIGIHLDGVALRQNPDESSELTTFEQRAWSDGRLYEIRHGVRTDPEDQTADYGLVDSPAGQCAWIVEKFWAWTDHDRDLDAVIPRDELLDTVTLYWLTATGASSGRMYWENPFPRSLTGLSNAAGRSMSTCLSA